MTIGYVEGRLLIEPMEEFWCLREPFAYVSAKGVRVDLTEGFLFDGFSAPRAFWSLRHPLDKRLLVGGVVHDFCFATHCLSFVDANELLVEIVDATPLERRLIFDAVQTFGADAYATGPARQAALKKRLLAMGLD